MLELLRCDGAVERGTRAKIQFVALRCAQMLSDAKFQAHFADEG